MVEKMYLFTGLKRPGNSKPSHRKRLQGAVDARRRACRRTHSYFKCPGTKQMRCPVNAYEKIDTIDVYIRLIYGYGIEQGVSLPDFHH
jgi:hypothetical protein